ncbi:YbaY family lipoprotein [Ferrimonas pelagia]|uniref:YbaY family lipoprotein n=1 Tax=Ferrimonas pelagia TaxID=1177826 RepID=A0ABP9F4H7_9GAMM
MKLWGGMALVALLGLGGCGPAPEPKAMVQISGEAFYRERVIAALGSVMTISLQDVSRQDVAATVIAKQTQQVQGPPPFAFVIDYDPDLIDPRMTYSLSVRIEERGELRFISPSHENPFEGDNRILLQAVGQ